MPTLRTTRPCSRYHPSSQLKRKTFLSSCSGPANAALARGGSAPQPYLVPRPGPGHSIHCCCVRETPAVLKQVGGVSFKRKWSAPQTNVPLMRTRRKKSIASSSFLFLPSSLLPPILCLFQMRRSTGASTILKGRPELTGAQLPAGPATSGLTESSSVT